MYFERGGYDPNASSEAQQRLASFSNATSISSNQYFGREEEEDGEYEGGDGGRAASGDFGELEATARDYYQRFMDNPDVQSGIESFRAGALKVSCVIHASDICGVC
jgi:ADP-ribosylation factor GTPase-activating protein 2/3